MVNKTRFLVFGHRDLDFLVNDRQLGPFWSKSTKVNILGQSQQKSTFLVKVNKSQTLVKLNCLDTKGSRNRLAYTHCAYMT